MFSYITAFFEDPRAMLMFVLLALPGRMLAISAHDYAHAYVADKCGDPTARMLGRLTLNPFKHLDLIGTIMMLVLGFGWAKPVPINPRNYRNPRRDDLKVSLAGVIMNLIMALAGFVLMGAMMAVALGISKETFAVTGYMGENVLVGGGYYCYLGDVFYAWDMIIVPSMGRMAGYVYQMIFYFAQVNIILAVFNMIPLPPLDGYHVLNDLLIRRPLFASYKAARIATGVMFALMVSGLLGRGLGFVRDLVFSGLGNAFTALLEAIGILQFY